MVIEREPPKPAASPKKQEQPIPPGIKQPEFGKASPLRNPLHPDPVFRNPLHPQPAARSNIFNIPSTKKPRPEHHREFKPINNLLSSEPQKNPVQPVDISSSPVNSSFGPQGESPQSVIEVPKPPISVVPAKQTSAAPLFSSRHPYAGFAAVNPNPRSQAAQWGNPTGNSFGNPDEAEILLGVIGSDAYGDYVDTAKATENIKELLEGAFEDEDSKPRTRGRKKKAEAAVDDLTKRLDTLGVKAIDQDKKGHNYLEEEEDDEEEEYDGTVEGLAVKLLPHQAEGVDWMRDKEVGTKKIKGVLPKGGILADDMGLGKTIQSISLILTNPRPAKDEPPGPGRKAIPEHVGRNTLVVGPLALIKQWEAEIKSRVSDSHKLRVLVHHGPNRTKRYQDLLKYDVVITTYQILVSEHGSSAPNLDGPQAGCFGIHWYRVILDEAHTIKNRRAKAHLACCALRAEYRWCLTGTPMQNNLDELQALISFLRVKPYNDIHVWKNQITKPMAAGKGGVAMKRLQFYLKAFMKRRTKDILKKEGALNAGGKPSTGDDPTPNFKIVARKIECIEADFTPSEKTFYERLEDRTGKNVERLMEGAKFNYASALVMLLRLRQACNHPKLVGGSIMKDQEALATSQANGTQTSRKAKPASENAGDDLADLMGGLTVASKQCDICQIELNKDDAANGAIHCLDCEQDLSLQLKAEKSAKNKKHHRSSTNKVKDEKAATRRARGKKVILDDSDDENGDWIVPESQQPRVDLGVAGGTDDEDAEGGGDSLGSEDSQTDEDSDVEITTTRRKKTLLRPDMGSSGASDDDSDNDTSTVTSNSDSDTDTIHSTHRSRHKTSSRPELHPSTKITRLLHLLRTESPAHKFIVFSTFTTMLDLIEPFLHRSHLPFTRYDGSMRNDARELSLSQLRNDPSTRILLCSLKCGSLGLNLTAASRVVILEPFWNPFVEEQAIDRVHRLNQTQDVVVYKMTIKGSVEERILDLQEKKRALAEAAIEGKAATGKLSLKDILSLFRHDADEKGHERFAPKVKDVGLLRKEGLGGSSQGEVSAPRAMGTMEKSGRRKEDAVFGRRW